MNQYNILHILESLYKAGTPNKLLMLFRNINKKKYKIILVIYGKNNDLYNEFKKNTYKIIRLKPPNDNGYRMLLSLINIIRKENIDIVNTHYNRANIIGGLAAILTGIPFIQNEHGIPRGGDAKKFPFNLIVDFFDNFYCLFRSAIICNSYTVKKDVKKKIFCNNKKIFVVPNAIDVKEYTNMNIKNKLKNFREVYKIDETDIALGSVGGLIKGRDYLTYIEVIKILKRDYANIKYFIAGWGGEKEKIRQKINQYGLDNNIVLLDYYKEVPILLNIINIYLDAVLIASGVGLGLLEAMYFKLPVIGIMEGDKRDIVIKNDFNGYLIDRLNIKLLYEKIKYLIENEDIRKKFGENSRKLIIEKYNQEIFSKNISNIYSLVISRKIQK